MYQNKKWIRNCVFRKKKCESLWIFGEERTVFCGCGAWYGHFASWISIGHQLWLWRTWYFLDSDPKGEFVVCVHILLEKVWFSRKLCLYKENNFFSFDGWLSNEFQTVAIYIPSDGIETFLKSIKQLFRKVKIESLSFYDNVQVEVIRMCSRYLEDLTIEGLGVFESCILTTDQ